MVCTSRREFLERMATTAGAGGVTAIAAVAAFAGGAAGAATPASVPANGSANGPTNAPANAPTNAAPAKAASGAQAASAPPRPVVKLDATEPMAVALGFVADTSQVDAKKFPNHNGEQKCGNCQLFGAATGSASGPCGIFSGKHVPAAGWCVSWDKKAALKVDPKLGPKADPKGDRPTEPKAEPRAEPKAEPRAEPKAEPRATSKAV